MNHNSEDQALQWSETEQMDPMAAMQNMDFSNFLDMGDLDLSGFNPLGIDQQFHVDSAQHGHHPGESHSLQSDPLVHDFGVEQFELSIPIEQEQALHTTIGHDIHDFANHSRHGVDQAWSQAQQEQSIQGDVFNFPQRVPPTPNSYEMHGNPGRYLQQQMDPQTRNYLEQRYQLKKDDALAFSPLVSPAVTPQDSHFQTLPEYTIPGAYFSPLTSPALQAQNASQRHRQIPGFHANPSTATSSVATSPIDLNMDVDMVDDNGALLEPARRSRRKTQTARSAGPTARVRQSPIVKAQQKRKSTHLSSVIPTKEMMTALQEVQHAQPLSANLLRGNHPFVDSSGTDSISPEPLSESLMGPPPRPASAMQSPALTPQMHSAPASVSVNGSSGAPATPASLMSLQRSNQIHHRPALASTPLSVNTLPNASDDHAMLDDFVLPPAAETRTQRPAMDRIISSAPPVSVDATPRMAARKTPKFGPSSTPQSAMQPPSVTSSPCISAVASPSVAATPTTLNGRVKLDSKSGPRSSKKRGSIGGPLISPAIRPKISPSIKPLLPEGAKLSESQQALLLASKSNYTHILEGTLLPGVSYPESLSSGLTSKRTSHKIAEQGRRNRINDALKEMQGLLPKPGGKSKGSNDTPEVAEDDDEDNKDSPKTSAEGKSASSKAATVESAIEYIKALQQEMAQTAKALQERDAEMSMLRKKLQDAGLESDDQAAKATTNETPATDTTK